VHMRLLTFEVGPSPAHARTRTAPRTRMSVPCVRQSRRRSWSAASWFVHGRERCPRSGSAYASTNVRFESNVRELLTGPHQPSGAPPATSALNSAALHLQPMRSSQARTERVIMLGSSCHGGRIRPPHGGVRSLACCHGRHPIPLSHRSQGGSCREAHANLVATQGQPHRMMRFSDLIG